MTGSILMLIAVVVPAQGEPPRSPCSAGRPRPAPITVEVGLATIETLRSDGLGPINHLATAGRTMTAERIESPPIEGPFNADFRGTEKTHSRTVVPGQG